MQRRTYLERIAGVAVVALAGCSGDGGSTPTETAETTPTDTTPSPTTSPTATTSMGETADSPTPTETPTPTASPSPTPESMPTATESPSTGATATPTATRSPTPTATPTPAKADQVVEVGPEGRFRFSPESFTIEAGSTVLWTWKSGGHNVVPESTPSDSSWEGTPGDGGTVYDEGYTYTHVFTVPGEYEYYCAPHRSLGMTGSFTVE